MSQVLQHTLLGGQAWSRRLRRNQRLRLRDVEGRACVSALLFNASAPLKIIRGQTLAPSFSLYIDDADGKIDDNGRTVSRKILHWNGKIYR